MAAAAAGATLDRNAALNPLDAAEVPHPMSKRWVPYKHSSGMAIYLHQNITQGHDFVGGEFMVSSTVRGSPQQCLAALTHSSSSTSILGPAAAVQVLSRNGDAQVLHLQLPPPLCSSLCSSLCAPRHAVVRQVLTEQPSGILCLMFSSLQQQEAQQALQQQQQQRELRHHHHHHHHHNRSGRLQQQQQQQQLQQQQHRRYHRGQLWEQQQPQQWWLAAAVRACRRLDAWLGSSHAWLGPEPQHSSSSSGSGSGGSSGSGSLCLGAQLWRPVLLDVAGGYTISGLGGCEDDASPESLVTCILKVDLGGWLSQQGPAGWLYSPALALGVVEALLEQLLGSVGLVKAEVEAQRFASYSPAVPEEAVPETPDSSSAAAAAAPRRQDSSATAATGQTSHRQSTTSSRRHSSSQPHRAANGEQFEQRQQQQQCSGSSRCQRGTLLGVVQGLLQNLSSLASWGLGASLFSSSRDGDRPAAVAASRAASASGGRDSSEAGTAAAAAAAAHADDGSLADQLVGLDGGGQQLTGLCNRAVWSELHAPGTPSLFKVRGPNYLADRGKVPAGQRAYCLLAVDLVTTPTAVQHVARFLPSVRRCRAASCFVFNMMVPAADSVLNLVMTFGSSSHWQQLAVASRSSSSTGSADTGTGSNGGSDAGSSSGSWASGSGIRACTCSSSSSSSGACQWSGLDHVLYRFIHASDTERSSILKMIPHIEVGSWVVKQAVGTTPFIVGRKLATTYHLTDRYMEVDIDVTTCKTAGYIVQSIRGVTTSMVVDLAFLLEGQRPAELPEQLLGAVRFTHLDMAAAVPLDISREVPPWPQPWEQLQG